MTSYGTRSGRHRPYRQSLPLRPRPLERNESYRDERRKRTEILDLYLHPKSVDPDKKYPLIVLPHSGVHADFNTYYAHIVRELIAQEYIVVSAEYRGSTGVWQSYLR